MRFPFGKYKDYTLDEIPASYLALALEEFTLDDRLYSQCRAELSRRFELSPSVSDTCPGAEQQSCAERARRIYRELAKKYHPDRQGGDTAAMQAINDFHQAMTSYCL